MDFKHAFTNMKKGLKMKRKDWGGYWYWDDNKETIMIQCRPQDADAGDLLDIRDTKRVEFTLMHTQATDWEIATIENCPMLGGESRFSFEDAIKYLKRGFKVARKGWNGKHQYIQLATCISYKTISGDIINHNHNSIGNAAIAFVGTSGTQIGWLASQADMLADDWTFAD